MKNMTLQNPVVVPKTVGGDASIKFGKAGGVATGTWWETGLKTNSDFQIAKENDIKNGGILFKNDGGIDIGTSFTMTPEMLKKKEEGIAAGEKYIEIPHINIMAMTKTFSLPVTRGGIKNNENSDIMGNVHILSPLHVYNDRGIMWMNTSTTNNKKGLGTNGLAIGPVGGPTGVGIASVGSDLNQSISLVPKGDGTGPPNQGPMGNLNGYVNILGNLLTTENIYNAGMVSNIKIGIPMTYSVQSFGPCWNIDTTDWLAKINPYVNALLNIHHLIIWDTLTGSSYFAVVGFTDATATSQPDVVFLSSTTKNKGVLINAMFGYNASNKPFIYVKDIPENNKLLYRIS